MSRYKIFFRVVFTLLFSLCANSFLLIRRYPLLSVAFLIGFLLPNLLCGFTDTTIQRTRLRFCNHGVETLIVFSLSATVSVVCHVVLLVLYWSDLLNVLFSVLLCVAVHAVLFWNGIISVYATSVQLGIKQRVIGALCGPIPIVHLFALKGIIRTTHQEVVFETQKEQQNRARRDRQICRTRYPILLVHGVFFRDSERLNYWGRVPAELQENGATLFYGEHQSALSIPDSAAELAQRIRTIVQESGCEKVNIIAHSKGGLDCRYALCHHEIAPYVASLTTINTPHRGCGFADYLLTKIPETVQRHAATAYNATAKRLGDAAPDFMAAVQDLTATNAVRYDESLTVPSAVYCQSVGSVLTGATGGKFPLNFSYPLVKHFDGENDGLVSEPSFAFGERYTLLRATGKRGISHGDMIDLNRENIPDFDVREFYVQLVSDLRERGL